MLKLIKPELEQLEKDNLHKTKTIYYFYHES